MTLSDYLTDTRRLLHDSTAQYWLDADLTAYINKGMQRVAERCKQVRLLQSVTLAAGSSPYSIAYGSLPNPGTIDVLGIVVIWGATRIQLRQVSYTKLTTFYQAWTTYSDVPQYMARYGKNQIILAPPPGITYQSEWDTAVYPPALAASSDADVSGAPYTEPVPYYAAYWAKMTFQQYDEAAKFNAMYKEAISACPTIAMERMIESMYDQSEDD